MKKIILLVSLILILGQGQSPAGTASGAGKLRYISLAPSTTEILFALGLNQEIVGISSYCNYPPETQSKARVGDFSHPSIEKIFSLKPDYIFCTGLEQAPVIEQLKQLKFNIYVADPSSMEELFDTINDIGMITSKNKEAQELIRKMRRDIEEVGAKVSLIPPEQRPKVFVEIWHEPLMSAGKGSLIDEIIALAGGTNIAHDTRRAYSIFSSEKVISLNPDCIIMAYMDKEPALKLVENRFGWRNIKAVKNKRVFNDIDPDTLLRPGPRITSGLKEINKRLYP
ncbi:cobalamin-binding protein [bacterium]|nr:MAG: cobalamin-binding protein [bacterium]